ncbi:alpha-(1-_3)-arabinofuranosyltransferase family protein [Actinoplanes sp. KI2]|nr:alpha-(1->3)-arabinofuranosyltransferase family protein [Actinoplanes sp. KI2]MCU7728045.1 alpha-(1->3)-arabinofuranosyltransferase family protein [Actinoplanes sp. KI2]
MATGCVLLTALAFWQQPGRIVPDTKVDLVVAPGAWLARALHAWDPAGNFGQMQNQAYGYLWPMGPFFALGKLIGVPEWAVQRLWWALLLCTAFTGVVLLAGRLGIGTPAARLAGGLVFALCPRILSELGPVSVEVWPSAVAPWVLLPLVALTDRPLSGCRRPVAHSGSADVPVQRRRWLRVFAHSGSADFPVQRRRLVRAVALSGLAVATAGGVNATAVLAVLPLPLLWLLTVRPLRWRLTVAAAWGIAVACATAWWVVPLLLLGRYSPPFLNYIETAATTTRTTDVVSTARGASHWLAYLGTAYGPTWPTGWRLATEALPVVATMVIAGLGLAGLARRGMPHRRFLIAAALTGVAAVGFGHLSGVPGLDAVSAHAWLDAAGAPLRNLHKFDVLLRLPLALGLTHLLGTVLRAAHASTSNVTVPNAAVPNAAVPNAAVPNAAVPNAAVPNVAVPNVAVPNAAVPNAAIPNAAIPNAAIPNVAVPNVITPNVMSPNVQDSNVSGPNVLVGRVPAVRAGVVHRPIARLRAVALGLAAAMALAIVAGPALGGGLPGSGSFTEVPGYWRTAASWLNAHTGSGRVLVVPGARFPSYLWGAPGDEMVQPLLTADWAVRNSIPLVPPATVRLLDTIESVLATGQSSPGLATLLARSGVRYLLVRADLDTGRSDSLRQLTVRATLDSSPGLRPVITFGPDVGGQPLTSFVDRGLDVRVPALEVYEVDQPAAPIGAYDMNDVRTVVGGPESLLQLAYAGQLGAAPTVLAADQPADVHTGGTVVTDGQRRREVTFGQARDNASATMTATEQWRLAQPAHDYTSTDSHRWQTMAQYLGVRDVSASSSYAEALPLTANRPEHLPYAALDGDPDTSWRSAPATAAIGQWLSVTLDRPRVLKQVRITFDLGADAIPTRIGVRAGDEWHELNVSGETVTVPLDGWFAVSRLTVVVEAVWSVRLGYGGVGIAELTVPGVQAQRTLVLPAEPRATGDTPVALATRAPAPAVLLDMTPSVPSCFFLAGRPYCSADAARGSEDGTVLDRTVPWSLNGVYSAQLWGRARAGPALDAVLDRALAGPDTPRVTASSTGVADPAARAGAVVDGDSDTTWYASDDDHSPWLRLDWVFPRVLTGLHISLGPRAAAARPWSVTVLTDSGARSGTLDADGTLTFDRAVLTDDVTVLFTGGSVATSFSPYAGRFERLPVGVGELTVLGKDGPARLRGGPATVVRLPCGSGPTLEVGGKRIRTAFTATISDLLQRRELPMRLCETDQIRPGAAGGPVRVVATASVDAEPTRVALLPIADSPARSQVDAPPVGGPAISRADAPAVGGPAASRVDTPSVGGPAASRVDAPSVGGPAASPVELPGGGGPAASPVDSVLSIDRWQPDRRRVTLAPWATERVLVLRENTNAGWQARIGGHVLRPIVIDGWQQGWIIPAGWSGAVTIDFAPDQPYRAGLIGGALLAGLVLLAAILPMGRAPATPGAPATTNSSGAQVAPTEPIGRRRRWKDGSLMVLGAVFLVVAGGYAAAACALAGIIALLVLRRPKWIRRGERWAPVVLWAVACVLSLRSATPHIAIGPQLAGLAAFAALWLGTLPPGLGRASALSTAAPSETSDGASAGVAPEEMTGNTSTGPASVESSAAAEN